MDNRGSKSMTEKSPTSQKSVIVKEQRVDGSYKGIRSPLLRCTLVGFERNYQTKTLSKRVLKATISTLSQKLNP